MSDNIETPLELDTLLKMGWDEFKVRTQFSSQDYNRVIKSLNPYLITLYELYERFLRLKREHKQIKVDLEHYKSRYLEISKMLAIQNIELSKIGIK